MKFINMSELQKEFKQYMESKLELRDKYLKQVAKILDKIATETGYDYVAVDTSLFTCLNKEMEMTYINDKVLPIVCARAKLSDKFYQEWMHEKGYDKRAIINDTIVNMSEEDKKDFEVHIPEMQEAIQQMYKDLPEEFKKDMSKAIVEINKKLKDNPIKF